MQGSPTVTLSLGDLSKLLLFLPSSSCHQWVGEGVFAFLILALPAPRASLLLSQTQRTGTPQQGWSRFNVTVHFHSCPLESLLQEGNSDSTGELSFETVNISAPSSGIEEDLEAVKESETAVG